LDDRCVVACPSFSAPCFDWDRVGINQSATSDRQPWGGWPLINKQKFVRWLQSHFCCTARFDREILESRRAVIENKKARRIAREACPLAARQSQFFFLGNNEVLGAHVADSEQCVSPDGCVGQLLAAFFISKSAFRFPQDSSNFEIGPQRCKFSAFALHITKHRGR
jgi:hypothetical protein